MWLKLSREHGHRKKFIINKWIKEFGPSPTVKASPGVDYWLTLDETGRLPEDLADIAIGRIIEGRSKHEL